MIAHKSWFRCRDAARREIATPYAPADAIQASNRRSRLLASRSVLTGS